MFKLLTNLTLVFMLMTSSFAAPLQSGNVSAIVMKYDYLLTAHPKAHEENFRAETIKSYTKELKAATKGLSKDELLSNLDALLIEIPQAKTRAEFKKVLLNSSADEVSNLISSPELFSKYLAGEGANFALKEVDPDKLILAGVGILFGGLIIAAIVSSIVDNAKYEYFSSYFKSMGAGSCEYGNYTSALYDHEEADMIENAKQKCLAGATYPETCRPAGWTGSLDSYTNEWGQTRTDCDVYYEYKADKQLSTEQ